MALEYEAQRTEADNDEEMEKEDEDNIQKVYTLKATADLYYSSETSCADHVL